MTAKSKNYRSRPLSFRKQHRPLVAVGLLESLEEDDHPAVLDKAWAKEIRRRIKEVDEGEAELIPWEVVAQGTPIDVSCQRKFGCRALAQGSEASRLLVSGQGRGRRGSILARPLKMELQRFGTIRRVGPNTLRAHVTIS